MADKELFGNSEQRKEETMEELRKCPFCGSEVGFMTLMKMFYCKNYKDCGAIVSFDNPAANNFDKAKIECWNRRTHDDGR